jgi:hypothetical protein
MTCSGVKFTSNTVEQSVHSQADTAFYMTGSLPHSQNPIIGPCPASNESSPNPPTLFLHDPFSYHFPIYTYVFRCASFLQANNMSIIRQSLDPHFPGIVQILTSGLRCFTDLPQISSSQRHLCVSCSSSSQSEMQTYDFKGSVKCGKL